MLSIKVSMGLKSKIRKLVTAKIISDIVPYFRKGNIGMIQDIDNLDKIIQGQ